MNNLNEDDIAIESAKAFFSVMVLKAKISGFAYLLFTVAAIVFFALAYYELRALALGFLFMLLSAIPFNHISSLNSIVADAKRKNA